MRHNVNKEGNSYRVTDGTTVRYSETWRPSPASRRKASDCKVYNANGELVRTIKASTKRNTSRKPVQRTVYVKPTETYNDRMRKFGAIDVD